MQNDSRNTESFRRVGTCATLAMATTIGLFSLVAHWMSHAIDRAPTAVDDAIPTLELTVVKAKRGTAS